ncbi:hypothetical protein Fcan01_26219 [Folsomia candida]|uniref:Uncharacterized protein n=1 Tax=Folsomia candida TaxID=158441 RepID=A0A226D149_FOLCA|nr:hypothetical protein Fcan01_26219 [Folsomia candida]
MATKSVENNYVATGGALRHVDNTNKKATKFVENNYVATGGALRHVDNTNKKGLSQFDGNRPINDLVMAWRQNLSKTTKWRRLWHSDEICGKQLSGGGWGIATCRQQQ